MTVTVQFCRWQTVSRVTGERRPIPTTYADRHGATVYLPEAQGHAVARQLARREAAGARVVGPKGETIGPHYLWDWRRQQIVERRPR